MENIIKTQDLMFYYSDISDEEQQEQEENAPKAEKKMIFEDLDLEIEKGSFTVILGHNGCGKSTLAKHFNAILMPCGGKVYSAGFDTSDEEKLFDIRKRVGMVFQNPDNQIVASVVEEDVAFALENMGVEQGEMRRRVDDALKAVGMYDYRLHAPSQLSGGQKQRVAIAGIIAMRPSCIVLDEPTAMLDPTGRSEVLKTVRRLNREEGITIVLITHYMDEAAQADRVVVMEEGKIILDDRPENVFSNVELLQDVGLDVPQSTQLMYMMKQNGFDADTHIINEKEAADFLFELFKRQVN
ncbi:MAG: energy-coupling factor transporter ATPase [Oscillospiraceae bacterium]|nr:energy-coupling factor transporter ATPase [Oscillospiraceae bacterium]